MARQLSDSNQKKLTDKARQLIADERAMRGSVWLHTGGYLWNASAIIEGVLSVINGILLIAMLIGLLLTVDGMYLRIFLSADKVTEETIRRDLDKLEKEGYATKTYGGAILGNSTKNLVGCRDPTSLTLLILY